LNEEAPIIPCADSYWAFRVLLPSHVTKPLLDVLGAHAGCTRRSAVRKLTDYFAQLAIRRDIVVDRNWGDIYGEGFAGRIPPSIKIDPIGRLTIQRLATRFRLCVGRGPVPPFQVAKGLMDVPHPELRLDRRPYSGCAICPILAEGHANLAT
jgi:hypothetical protein